MNIIEETIKDCIYNHCYTQKNVCEVVTAGAYSGMDQNKQYAKVVIYSKVNKPILKEWLESLRDLSEGAIISVCSNGTRVLVVDFSSRPYPVGPLPIPDFSASHMVDALEKALNL